MSKTKIKYVGDNINLKICVSLLTGKPYYSRAKVCVDTWIANFKGRYLIHSQDSCDFLKISITPNTGEDRNSGTRKRLLGMLDLYKKFPDCDWYFMASCDNYVFYNRLISLLRTIKNVKLKPIYLGGPGWTRIVRNKEIYFHSGGAGYLFNRIGMGIITKEIKKHINDLSFFYEWECCEDVIIGYIVSQNTNFVTICDGRFNAFGSTDFENMITTHYQDAEKILFLHNMENRSEK